MLSVKVLSQSSDSQGSDARIDQSEVSRFQTMFFL
jgi:hypothetical protein